MPYSQFKPIFYYVTEMLEHDKVVLAPPVLVGFAGDDRR